MSRLRRGTARTAVITVASLVAALTGGAAYAVDPGVVVRGTVTKPDGTPLAGATVTLTSQRPDIDEVGQTYREAPLVTAISGADGTYALPLATIPLSLVPVAQHHGGYLNLWVHAVKLPAAPTATASAPVDVQKAIIEPAPVEVAPALTSPSVASATVHAEPPAVETGDTPTAAPDPSASPVVHGDPPPVETGDTPTEAPDPSASPVVHADPGTVETGDTPTAAPSVAPIQTTQPTVQPTVKPTVAPTAPPLGETSVGKPESGIVWSATDIVYVMTDAFGVVELATGTLGETLGGLADPVMLETTASSYAEMQTGTACSRKDPVPQYTVIERTNPYEPFVELHTGWDMRAEVAYGSHANTDLSGAFKPSGGNWKATVGMSHMGNKKNLIKANQWQNEGWTYLTQFSYKKERIDWYDKDHPGTICMVEYRISPTGWLGQGLIEGKWRGGDDTYDRMVEADRNGVLGMYTADKEHIKETARTRVYTTEAQAFGIQLKAQSSFSKQVDLHYWFGPSKDRPHYIFHPTKTLHHAPAIYSY